MIKQHLNDRISKHNFKTMKPNMETDTKLDHKYFSVVVFNMGNKVCGFTKLGVIIIVVGKGKKKKIENYTTTVLQLFQNFFPYFTEV